MKTDLARILSVSGQSGLFSYVSQGKSGVIVESLVDKTRKMISISSKVTAMSDVAIYTDEEELPLKEVFKALGNVLDGKVGPNSKKASQDEIVALFAKAVPNYDSSRFYFSHMKKVLDWYNCLVEYASLDFVEEEESEEEPQETEA